MEDVLGQELTSEIVLPLEEYANQKNQEVSGAYQDAHTIFKEYSRFCAVKTNPMGETFMLGPEVAMMREHEKTVLMDVKKLSRFSVNRKLATVQFATRLLDNGKPVLNMPYSVVVNGNITSADLRINPQGTFEITANSIAELNRVDQIGKIADISLASVQERAKRKSRARKGYIGAAILTGGLGFTGFKIVDNIQEKARIEDQRIAEFDSLDIDFTHGVVAFGQESTIIIPNFESDDVAFSQIPKNEDHESRQELRVRQATTGTCTKIGNLSLGERILIAGEPSFDTTVVAVSNNAGEIFVCVPEERTYNDSGVEKTYKMELVAVIEQTSN